MKPSSSWVFADLPQLAESQSGRLKIAKELPHAATLREELRNFRVKVNSRTAHDSYEHWRKGDNDDLVLAAALAAWGAGIPRERPRPFAMVFSRRRMVRRSRN